MKHLVFLLTQLYPNRHFIIEEVFSTDEVFNIISTYYLQIEDNGSWHFQSFQELEDHILKLHEKDK